MEPREFPQIEQQLAPVFERHGREANQLLQILREVQEIFHFIPPAAITCIAAHLGVPRTRVEGVAGFYSFLSLKPVGEYRILFSDNITDQMQGNPELMRYFCHKLWLEPGKVSEDSLLSVDSTSCTGMCDQGPAALVNGWPLTNLDHERLDLIAELIRGRKPVCDWPPRLFEVKDNIRRSGTLLGEPFAPGAAIKATLARGSAATLLEMEASGLRGRGGAGFSVARKWSMCRASPGEQHYMVCNADEGEPGTFKDRVLLNSYADLVCEGMTVGARIIGATKGFLYLRGEYRYLLNKLEQVLARRRAAGLLGRNILGETGFDFDIEIHLGAGAYICGEESALIESLEGKRGRPRNRPPFPVTHGYLDQPTVVDNVETLACAARIAAQGGEWFAAMGTAQSSGSKILSIAGDCARPGIYEYPFGVTLHEILDDCGAEDSYAVQVSGPSGILVSSKEFGRCISFEDLPTAGAFTVFKRGRDLLQIVQNFAHFFAHESCGFCTPCRVGTQLQKKIVDKIANDHGTVSDLEELKQLGHIMQTMSHCGLGHTAPNPVLDMLKKFPDAYQHKLKDLAFEPAFDLDGALETARNITGRDDTWAHLP
ncbi:MAG: NAD(P)H-dependent oxidoreductase subunit E [Nitrosomonadaceae bacterium]|nr:NAD(P)H-dependent oxidoreductase subunit E [Nitrosomonadaceae bacterium]